MGLAQKKELSLPIDAFLKEFLSIFISVQSGEFERLIKVVKKSFAVHTITGVYFEDNILLWSLNRIRETIHPHVTEFMREISKKIKDDHKVIIFSDLFNSQGETYYVSLGDSVAVRAIREHHCHIQHRTQGTFIRVDMGYTLI